MRLGANRHGSREVGFRERFERIEDVFPATFPLLDQFGARRGWSLKLRVPVAIWLLTIGGQEVEPARAHIARQVFDNGGDGIGLRVEGDEERFIRALRHRSIAQLFVVTKETDGILQIRGVELVWHADILFWRKRLSTGFHKELIGAGKTNDYNPDD